MFETLRWRSTLSDTETAMRHAADSLARAGKMPLAIGSLAAVALLGMVTTMGINRAVNGRSRAKVVPARIRAALENARPAPRNGRRRRTRKTKAAAH